MYNIRILALSGSLRKASYNTALIRALSKIAPEGIEIIVFTQLGDLPLFNPDIEDNHFPAVDALRNDLGKSQGLLIASPEYAHGISGVLKNALDWLVSGEEFVDMPVALLNTSPRATHAQAALREVITTMSGIIIEEASIIIPLLGSNFNENDIAADEHISIELKTALQKFRSAIINNRDTVQ